MAAIGFLVLRVSGHAPFFDVLERKKQSCRFFRAETGQLTIPKKLFQNPWPLPPRFLALGNVAYSAVTSSPLSPAPVARDRTPLLGPQGNMRA
jgi:hypothetical protein